MVSYYPNPSTMFHQQTAPTGHFNNNHMHSWYTSGYPQPGPMNAHPGSYGTQQEEQMWHHQRGHGVFHHNADYTEFVHAGIPPIQQHHHGEQSGEQHHLPSPPITVSGSDMSSPDGQNRNISPPQLVANSKPSAQRSPYGWIRKNSYQREPNPGE